MDKRDYTEPACPMDNSMWTRRPGERARGQRLDLQPVLARYDACMARGEKAQAGKILETALAEARVLGDRHAELSLLSEQMGYYRQAGEPEKGIPAVEQGFALLEELGLAGTVTGGTILINGATALSAYGEAKRALRYYEEAFRCYGAALDPTDLRFAALMNNMAAAYDAAGDREQAVRYYRGALQVLSHHPGNPDTAVTHINLAQLYAGEDEAAVLEELRLALESLDDPNIVWNEYYAYTCRKCAAAFAAFGMDDAVREMTERAEIVHEHAGD